MGHKVDNAIIMAAGCSSRFAPISYECPKALLKVKGEILIERQIVQLQQAGIKEIIVAVGYKKEKFYYLKEKYGVVLIENKDYRTRNNHASIYAAKDYLKNTYICSADNYFIKNPFESVVDESYYASVYAKGYTKEWCICADDNDFITSVTVGGNDSWYMLGHAFWSYSFSNKIIHYIEQEYNLFESRDKFWEDIYIEHIDELKMKIRHYEDNNIYEFDSLAELREFDETYMNESGSAIMEKLAEALNCKEKEIDIISPLKCDEGEINGFCFMANNKKYRYLYETGCLQEL